MEKEKLLAFGVLLFHQFFPSRSWPVNPQAFTLVTNDTALPC